MSVLPFSNMIFFIGIISFIIALHATKSILAQVISYKLLLFIATVSYVSFLLPHSTSKAIAFGIAYIYGIYWLSDKLKVDNPLWLSLIIAAPMVLFKLDIGPFYKILGLSYITFRAVQAIIDTRNYGKLSFIEFSTFVLFPTTLVAGPIDRSYRFKNDLDSGYDNLTKSNLINGWNIFLVGVAFKFILADLVNLFWLSSIKSDSILLWDMINSAYSYTTFLFFDFAGYSAMAVGISKMLGINIPINFNHPYLAQNPQEFWRRFHITLGAWLTDYFFKPIYKSLHQLKSLKGRRLLIQNIAIISTFLLMGMWNGLTWYYIFSGFLFGLYSAIHNCYVLYVRKGGYDFFTIFPDRISINIKRFLMINFAVLSLYFFSGRVPL